MFRVWQVGDGNKKKAEKGRILFPSGGPRERLNGNLESALWENDNASYLFIISRAF